MSINDDVSPIIDIANDIDKDIDTFMNNMKIRLIKHVVYMNDSMREFKAKLEDVDRTFDTLDVDVKHVMDLLEINGYSSR